jgi:periplasmic mercuric ion binding protein
MKNVQKFLIIAFVLVTGMTACGQKAKTEKVEIKTSAVCGMCKTTIETGLAFEKGIRDATLDVETKIVTVNYNPSKTNVDTIRKAISKLGYDADDVPADKAAYDKLSPCCKKGNEKH